MNPNHSVLLFILGIIIAFTPLLAPVHEVGHYLMAWLANDQEEFEWMTWSSTHGIYNAGNIVAGYYFEIIVFTLIGLVCLAGRTPVAFFFLGYAQCTWLIALSSSDFNSYAVEVAEYLGRDPDKLIEGFRQPWIRNGILLWTVIDLSVLFRVKKLFGVGKGHRNSYSPKTPTNRNENSGEQRTVDIGPRK